MDKTKLIHELNAIEDATRELLEKNFQDAKDGNNLLRKYLAQFEIQQLYKIQNSLNKIKQLSNVELEREDTTICDVDISHCFFFYFIKNSLNFSCIVANCYVIIIRQITF